VRGDGSGGGARASPCHSPEPESVQRPPFLSSTIVLRLVRCSNPTGGSAILRIIGMGGDTLQTDEHVLTSAKKWEPELNIIPSTPLNQF
jgi:hypothetical protein